MLAGGKRNQSEERSLVCGMSNFYENKTKIYFSLNTSHIQKVGSVTDSITVLEGAILVCCKISLAVVSFQFMYILGLCLMIELAGAVVALIFRNQVSWGYEGGVMAVLLSKERRSVHQQS